MSKLTPPQRLVSPRRQQTVIGWRKPSAQEKVEQPAVKATPITEVPPKEFKDLPIPEAAKLLGYGAERGRGVQRASLKDVALYLNSQGFNSNELATFFRNEGGVSAKGETGYILGKIIGSDTSGLPPNVKAWYESQRAITNQVLADVKERIAKNIAKLKASGKEYDRSDILRIQVNALPNWSDQDKEKKKLLKKQLAYEAKIEAWRASQPKKEGEIVTDITIGATDEEQSTAKSEQESGISCPGTIETYKVKLKDGSYILVEALDKPISGQDGEDLAKKKAEVAGYKVAWATKKFKDEVVRQPSQTITWAGMEISPLTTTRYTFTLDNGKTRTIDVLTEEDAGEAAKKWGAKVESLTEVGQGRVMTAFEVKESLRGAKSHSLLDYARALITYRESIPEDMRPPDGAIAVRSGSKPDDIIYLTISEQEGLRHTEYYQKARGDDKQKLQAAILTINKLPHVKCGDACSMPKESIKDTEGNIVIMGWNDVPSRYHQIGQDEGLQPMMERMFSDHQNATEQLEQAGLGNAEDYTIPKLAVFARENPEGLDILGMAGFTDEVVELVKEFNKEADSLIEYIENGLESGALTQHERIHHVLSYGERQALARSFDSIGQGMSIMSLYTAGVFNYGEYNALKERFGEAALNVPSTSFESALNSEFMLALWKTLDEGQKVDMAYRFDQDYTKGSNFSSTIKGFEYEMRKGPWQTLVLAIPQSIASPFGKEATMEEARETLDKQYNTELEVLSPYVKTDTEYQRFDVEKVKDKLDTDPTFTEEVLNRTGYEDKEQLLDNLDYYNYATRVAPKEWAIAGLVGALTVMPFAGTALAGIGTAGRVAGTALAGIGTAGRVAGSFLSNALPITLGALCLPETIKLVKDPDSPAWLKGIAIGGITLMFSPLLGPTIRGIQFIKLASSKNYVPLRSLSMEASTARVPFTNAQIARMTNAGLKAADIMDVGTKIVKQLFEGKKVATINVAGIRIRVSNVSYQRMVGGSLFNSSPDGTLLARGAESQPIFRTFFTEGKVALEPLERAYLTGQRATRPTINEIRINDPKLVSRLFPQKRLIGGGKVIEPEAAIPTLDELLGMGYRLEPILGKPGRGITFDATLGKIQIRRYTLSKVVDNPTGLVQVKLGQTGEGGVVALGDFHGTAKYSTIFDTLNSSFGEPILKGNKNTPDTWQWIPSRNKGRAVVLMGDLIDRGPAYTVLRDTFNRIRGQAQAAGDDLVRLMGNHELAYLSGDVIKGGGPRGFPDIIPENIRASLRQAILADVKSGNVIAAFGKEGKLFTHAGISKGVFPKLVGKSPEYIANWLNKQLRHDVKIQNFSGRMYAKGRVEKGSSLSPNERAQGGIFWLRPQETKTGQLDWGFTQVVGHNPGWEVRRIWGPRFIETDVGTIKTGRIGAYVDTPYIATRSATIMTKPLGGTAPHLTFRIMAKLKLTAMRDTIADVFLGWDGRIQAIQKLKANTEAVKQLLKEIDLEIVKREKAGDLTGIKFLNRMRDEITSPSGSDYLYGGIQFWRDIVMGRQNSVKVLNTIPTANPSVLSNLLKTIVVPQRNQFKTLSEIDIQRLFGSSKAQVLKDLDIGKINTSDIEVYRVGVTERLRALVDIVDAGLERSIMPHLDNYTIARRYANNLQRNLTRYYQSGQPYDVRYMPRSFEEHELERESSARIRRELNEELRRRVDRYYRYMGGARVPYTGRAIRSPRAPTQARVPYISYAVMVPRVPPYPLAPYPPAVKVPKYPILVMQGGRKGYKIPEGSIAWRQGAVWKYIPPPWRQEKPITLSKPPIGALRSADKTPKQTIQMIGKPKAKVPKSASIDLGVVDIQISKYGKEITFTGKGLETIAGGGVASTTKGMSIPATAPMKVEGYTKLAFGTSLRSLTTESYRKDIPKKFADRALSKKLGKMSPQDIAIELKASGVGKERQAEILKKVPDRVRKQVELWLSTTVEYAPTRGFPKAPYLPNVLSRKKKRNKKVIKEKELVASASLVRA